MPGGTTTPDRTAFDAAWETTIKNLPRENPELLWKAVTMTLEYTATEGAVLAAWDLSVARIKDAPARFYNYDRQLKEFNIRYQTEVGRNMMLLFRVPGLMRPDLQGKMTEHVAKTKSVIVPTSLVQESEGKKEKGKAAQVRPSRVRKLMKYETAYSDLPLERALTLALWATTYNEETKLNAPIATSVLKRLLVESDLVPFRSKADITSTLNLIVQNRYASFIRAGTGNEGIQLLVAGTKLGAELASESAES